MKARPALQAQLEPIGLYCFHLKSVSGDLRDRRWFDSDATAFSHALGLLTPGAWIDVSERSRHVASLWGEASGFPAMIAPRRRERPVLAINAN